MLLHTCQLGLAFVQRQAKRIRGRMGALPSSRATPYVCFVPSAQLGWIVTHNSIPAHVGPGWYVDEIYIKADGQ